MKVNEKPCPVDTAEAGDALDFGTPSDPLAFADPVQVGEDSLTILHPPRDRLEGVEALCASAERTLRVVLYMINDDACGTRVRDALVAAAKRGVAVTALFDTFGSNEVAADFFDPLKAAGAHVGLFNSRRSLRFLIRNHQKIYVADEARAIVAGFNATNNYFGCCGEQSWEDMGIAIDGPTAQRLAEYCDALYRIALDGKARLRAVQALVKQWTRMPGDICILLGGPMPRLSPWAKTLRDDLRKGSRLDIVSAYFSPGYGFSRTIGRLAKRGSARMVLAGRTDNMATIGASRHLYKRLLKKGVEIHEYQPCCLHMKLIVVDDVVYAGSSNLDARSLFINLEIMLRIESAEMAAKMRELIDSMETVSELQTPELHRRRAGVLNRLRWAFSYFVVNTLDYTVSRRFNFGVRA